MIALPPDIKIYLALEPCNSHRSPLNPHARWRPKRLALSKELPRTRVALELPKDPKAGPCCQEPMTKMTADMTSKVDYVPASLMVKEYARTT